jgi:hypothetical protein
MLRTPIEWPLKTSMLQSVTRKHFRLAYDPFRSLYNWFIRIVCCSSKAKNFDRFLDLLGHNFEHMASTCYQILTQYQHSWRQDSSDPQLNIFLKHRFLHVRDYILPTSRKETPILAWDEAEAHIGPGQYGPRYDIIDKVFLYIAVPSI